VGLIGLRIGKHDGWQEFEGSGEGGAGVRTALGGTFWWLRQDYQQEEVEGRAIR
jgi:hypothetical protein